MTLTFPSGSISYGAADLRRMQGAHLRRALALSCALALLISVSLQRLAARIFVEPSVPPTVVTLPPPKDLVNVTTLSPRLAPPPSALPPQIGAPVAVPDVPEAPPDVPSRPAVDLNATVGPETRTGPTSTTTSTSEPDDRPDINQVFVGDTPPLTLRSVEPEYPDYARLAGIEGRVVLKALVGKDGKVEEVVTLSGNPILAEAASRAFAKWQFRPAADQGHVVRVWVQQSFLFRLH